MYSGARFERLFSDFIKRYNLTDMYSAAFYRHKTPEEHWAYWSMHIYHNRYAPKLNSLYADLFELMKDKNYFVITTNADHLFLKNDFDKRRLFYTQGDYGLFQCSVPCHEETYDNERTIHEMVERQTELKIPTELIPYCPVCGREMTVNLRVDGTFVQDDGWYAASKRYVDFIESTKGKRVLFLELGVGYNTPGIIKYPFWEMCYQNKNSSYVCVTLDDAQYPKEIADRAFVISEDIKKVVSDIS